MESLTESDLALGNDNERMVVANLWSYWAHLSIYRFAVPYCDGRSVLDVGSGVGYGADYLARHGARAHAYDSSADAVAYAARTFTHAPVTFEIADLNRPLPAADAAFEVVFSSNVFEHVACIDELIAECARVVTAQGTVIVAVPPVTAAWIAENDMRNHHHVHHLPPSAWHAKLSRFFGNIECHAHHGAGKWAEFTEQRAEIGRAEHEVTIRETDFAFPVVTIERLNTWQCITAIFVCRAPRAAALPPALAERMPAEWHTGALAAKIIGEDRARVLQLTGELQRERADHAALREQLASVLRSKSWRVTAPLRRIVARIRK
jgi:SAM-dependent methyltransferase